MSLPLLTGLLLALGGPALADVGGISSTAQLPERDRGGVVLGAHGGVLLPQAFSPLQTSYFVQAEAGYMLPYLRRAFALTASLSFSSPEMDGGGSDPRVPGGGYTYHVTQQQLVAGLTAWGRLPLGRFVPYVGIGPRFFFIKTISSGQTGPTVSIPTTSETSSEYGLGVPLGLDVLLGPGRIFFEAELMWAQTAQTSTGFGSLGSIALGLGYRFVI